MDMETRKLFKCMEIDHTMFTTSRKEEWAEQYDECLEKAFRHWLGRTLKGSNDKILILYGPQGCGKTSFLQHLAKHFAIDVSDEYGDIVLHIHDFEEWANKWHWKNAIAGSTNAFPPNLPILNVLFIPVKKISLDYRDIDIKKVIEELK